MEKQIVPLAGDMNQLNLGLNPEDRKTLIDNVNLIYHVAASVRFDDPLTDAVIMNIRGTREVCTLSLDAKHLEVRSSPDHPPPAIRITARRNNSCIFLGVSSRFYCIC